MPQERRRLVALVVALLLAGVTIKLLVHGNYCLVPSANLKPGEVGTAKTSFYGIPLYRATGTDHMRMYDDAIWWYEAAMLVEWGSAVAVGAVMYFLVARVLAGRQFSLRRLLVAMALIAVGCFEMGYIYSIKDKQPPMGTLDILAWVSFLPIIGAGLFTPLKRPILGIFLGFLAFVALLVWVVGNARGV